tara:strand:+ start:115 stop:426 length:312 start_codon:yes stop_codon:yes gene_type:complete
MKIVEVKKTSNGTVESIVVTTDKAVWNSAENQYDYIELDAQGQSTVLQGIAMLDSSLDLSHFDDKCKARRPFTYGPEDNEVKLYIAQATDDTDNRPSVDIEYL